MSSRNGYLDATERAEAIRLNQVLTDFCSAVRALRASGGCQSHRIAELEAAAMGQLASKGWVPDYLTLRRRVDLMPAGETELAGQEPLVALAAARLGTPRLLDNQEV
jgi:pantoate--beta-alanine ligase